jgi:hypothetical protein
MPRGLVIGAQTMGLSGVDNDVHDVAAWLADHHFELDVRRGSDASHDGMLDGLRALIAAVDHDEPAVVYFSGHGGVLEVAEDPRPAVRSWRPSAEPARLGFLVPVDYDPDDLSRALLETVWSAHIVELTRRTRHVVVIHDCCHAAQTVRHGVRQRRDQREQGSSGGEGFRRDRTRSVARTLITADELRALAATAGDMVHALGNPHAVRLVATGSHGLAWEREGSDRHVRGVLTSNLLAEARAIGDRPISWAELGGRVRARVLSATQGKQRLEIEGPTHRRLFALDDGEPCTKVTVRAGRGRFVLAAGRAHGVQRGDVFRAVGAVSPIAEVTQVGLLESIITVQHSTTRRSAFDVVPIQRATTFPIAIAADDPQARHAIAAAVAGYPRLRVEHTDHPAARIELAEGWLSLHDEHGPMGAPVMADEAGIAGAVARLARLGAGRTLLHIADQLASSDVVMEIERAACVAAAAADDDERTGTRVAMIIEPAAEVLGNEATIAATDRLCVRFTSRSERALWLHLFAIGPGEAVHALGPVSSGKQLNPWGMIVLGAVPGSRFGGFSLPWPGVSAEARRPIELVLIATSAATDLSSLILPDPDRAVLPTAADGEPPAELHPMPPPPVTRDVVGAPLGQHAVAARQRLWLLPDGRRG